MHRNGVIWITVPHCFMWRERNAWIFEGTERVTQELKMSLYQSLLGWINASGVSFFTSLTDLLNRCGFILISSICSPDYLIICPVCFGF